jgi:hypothetical protein
VPSYELGHLRKTLDDIDHDRLAPEMLPAFDLLWRAAGTLISARRTEMAESPAATGPVPAAAVFEADHEVPDMETIADVLGEVRLELEEARQEIAALRSENQNLHRMVLELRQQVAELHHLKMPTE